MKLSEQEIKQLIAAAVAAQRNAYAIHSGYAVGAALLTTDDHQFGGYIESQAYGLTCCAERVALFKAISEGYTKFKALAVITPDGQTPCGACRQLLLEVCGIIPVIIAQSDGSYTLTDTGSLLPQAWLKP